MSPFFTGVVIAGWCVTGVRGSCFFDLQEQLSVSLHVVLIDSLVMYQAL
jgi:hypothetical protein